MRNFTVVFGLLSALVLTACGGDEPEVLTGRLEAGGVQGVRYTTSSQAGLTDANGSYQYIRGETVYFTVGNVALGAVPAAERVTLFDLSGLAPPAAEKALRRELDRAARHVRTPFVGAVNRQRLLLALDADNDARNGYDLRGRANELANATLDFDQNLVEFARRLERLSPALTRNVPEWMSIVLLYRGADIHMSAREEVRREQVDLFGQHTIGVREHTPDGVRFATRLDRNGDGAWEYQAVAAFDVLGRRTREEVEFENLLLAERRISEPSYDAHGNLTGIREESSFGVLARVVSATTITLDSWNREDLRVTEHDFAGDGVVESRARIDTEYDARGNVHTVTYETDAAADGTVNRREVFTIEYDARNRARSQTWEVDTNADGIADDLQTSVGTWSADDRQFVNVTTADFDGDGIAETVSETRYELDPRGQVQRVTIFTIYGLDSGIEQEEVFENDSDGRPLVQTSRYEYGDIGLSHVATARNQYDDAGNLRHRVSEIDDGIDGSIDARATLTASIGAGGELLGVVYEGDRDWLSGVEPSTLTITNETFAAGVTVLAQKYFPAGGLDPAGAGIIAAGP